ncbi:hypothetical protein M2480_002121 [Parabacteroides sp. PFB2-12]|uniref:FtsL-like putative cell division protein n=1 Tax=unclassified Parabacteroides TaxID=2649774 RepID=UPI002476AEDD|nr:MULTISPECIES: FtsL-like putative cell division protein [unclassified Parabacteroides]MDH6342185.1 hypothetical protein [Parabacteroides sp. PM6-13]MDH6391131.1 hypothetical protein [Parabacteroides sp. PFB2-12]
MAQPNRKKKKEKRFSLLYILGGGILKEDFIVKHTKMIVLVVVLLFFFIGNRYTCMQKLKEIDRLQQQLQDVRFEALSISSTLTGHSRQSQIESLVEEQGLDLKSAKTPAYELYK